MKTRVLTILALLATVAGGLQGYLLIQHYQLHFGAASGKSICNISATWNCDAVAASPFSEFFGLPVAALGLIAHLVGLWLVFRWWLADQEDEQLEARANLTLATLSLAASVVMGLISSLAMNVFCLFCVSAYVISIVSFALVYGQAKTSIKGFSLGDFRTVPFLGIIAIPVLSLFLHSVWSHSWTKGLERFVNESVESWKNAPAQDMTLAGGIEYGASEDKAKMTIVEFADFRCIHCKMAGPTLHAFVLSRPDVRLVFRTFPLDGQCNPSFPQAGDGMSCKMAKAAYCAEASKMGIQAHDWMFERFGQVPADFLASMAADLKIDAAALETCVQDEATHKVIVAQAEFGKRLGIEGTPTIFVNGKTLSRGQLLPVLQATYREITNGNL
jgi:protein-disulfide isomerase/uncharacterized membrane protein